MRKCILRNEATRTYRSERSKGIQSSFSVCFSNQKHHNARRLTSSLHYEFLSTSSLSLLTLNVSLSQRGGFSRVPVSVLLGSRYKGRLTLPARS